MYHRARQPEHLPGTRTRQHKPCTYKLHIRQNTELLVLLPCPVQASADMASRRQAAQHSEKQLAAAQKLPVGDGRPLQFSSDAWEFEIDGKTGRSRVVLAAAAGWAPWGWQALAGVT